MRPFLVGEANPYGADPEFALYPLPEEASGGRLARILGLSRTQYLRLFERRNLCPETWSAKVAKQRVQVILGECELVGGARELAPLVMLGAKVTRAFGHEFEPFTAHGVLVHGSKSQVRLCLPHPSGLSRAWNVPGAATRARELVMDLVARGASSPAEVAL